MGYVSGGGTGSGGGAVSTVAGRTGDVVLAESDVTSLVSDLALKATLASPTLTGTPLAPTAAQGTNTTQLATTAMVHSEAALLAPIASPTFTGTVTLPAGTVTAAMQAAAIANKPLSPNAVGYLAMTHDPYMSASGSLPGGTGVVTGTMIYLEKATTITQIGACMTVIATSPTNCFMAVYDTSGSRLAVSADLSSGFGTTGEKLSGALTVDNGKSITSLTGWVTVALLLGSGSGSSWAKTPGSQSAISAVVGRAHRGFTSGSSLTAMPSSITMSGVTDLASPLWFGVL